MFLKAVFIIILMSVYFYFFVKHFKPALDGRVKHYVNQLYYYYF